MKSDDYEIVKVSNKKHKFEWDIKKTKEKGFKGQEQEIVFITLKKEADIKPRDELDKYKWVEKKDLLNKIPYEDFKRVLEEIITC